MSVILVTDDNSEYRRSVMEILRLEGYDVIEAADGAEALEMTRLNGPDMILCDVDMPVMNGFEVLAALKTDPTLAQIPFLLVTGRADAASVAQGKQLGADDYMLKPMKIDLLLDKIQHYLNPPPQD
jgi:CheY-like chemotaxis protein